MKVSDLKKAIEDTYSGKNPNALKKVRKKLNSKSNKNEKKKLAGTRVYESNEPFYIITVTNPRAVGRPSVNPTLKDNLKQRLEALKDMNDALEDDPIENEVPIEPTRPKDKKPKAKYKPSIESKVIAMQQTLELSPRKPTPIIPKRRKVSSSPRPMESLKFDKVYTQPNQSDLERLEIKFNIYTKTQEFRILLESINEPYPLNVNIIKRIFFANTKINIYYTPAII